MQETENRESQERKTRQQGEHQGERERRRTPTTDGETRPRNGESFHAGNTRTPNEPPSTKPMSQTPNKPPSTKPTSQTQKPPPSPHHEIPLPQTSPRHINPKTHTHTLTTNHTSIYYTSPSGAPPDYPMGNIIKLDAPTHGGDEERHQPRPCQPRPIQPRKTLGKRPAGTQPLEVTPLDSRPQAWTRIAKRYPILNLLHYTIGRREPRDLLREQEIPGALLRQKRETGKGRARNLASIPSIDKKTPVGNPFKVTTESMRHPAVESFRALMAIGCTAGGSSLPAIAAETMCPGVSCRHLSRPLQSHSNHIAIT